MTVQPRSSAVQRRLVTIAEASQILAVCEKTVHNLVEAGRLPAIKLGDGQRFAVRFDLADLSQFIDSRRVSSLSTKDIPDKASR